MRQFLKRLLRSAGYDLDVLRDRSGNAVGLRMLRMQRKEDQLIAGFIRPAAIEDQQILFFIADEKDVVQREHNLGRFYETEELEIIRRHFRGGTFVDAGANVGNHSLFAAMILRAERVVAFEPNPLTALILRMNVGINDLTRRIEVHAFGLSDEDGRASIQHWPDHNLGAVQLKEAATGDIVLVRGDDILAGAPADFIKVDVEGMEMHVLRGLSDTIRAHRPVLFVEIFPDHADAFAEFLCSVDYRVTDTFERYETYVNYLAVPAEQATAPD